MRTTISWKVRKYSLWIAHSPTLQHMHRHLRLLIDFLLCAQLTQYNLAFSLIQSSFYSLCLIFYLLCTCFCNHRANWVAKIWIMSSNMNNFIPHSWNHSNSSTMKFIILLWYIVAFVKTWRRNISSISLANIVFN